MEKCWDSAPLSRPEFSSFRKYFSELLEHFGDEYQTIAEQCSALPVENENHSTEFDNDVKCLLNESVLW